MRKLQYLLLAASLLFSKAVLAWGKQGHEIVAEMAYGLLSSEAKQKLQQYLGNMKIADAGTWMDDIRSDKTYDYLKPRHYINIEKGLSYTPTNDENIVNEILHDIRELEHLDKLCPEQVKFDLLELFHLVGDIQQPLHVGYGSDKGGNEVAISFYGKRTNLHKIWDSELIEDRRISFKSIETAYKDLDSATVQHEKNTTVFDWLSTSRMYLPLVYNYHDEKTDDQYIKTNREIIISQLTNGGIHLAALLERLFGNKSTTGTHTIATDTAQAAHITAEQAGDHIGKYVTACGKVYGVKESAKVSFINMGASYPNSPLTTVIFAADKANIKLKLSKLEGKTICVTDTVEEYNGKAEIKVNNESQIVVQ